MLSKEIPGELARAIVRAVVDLVFRQALMENPERTLHLAGINLTESEMKILTKFEIEDWEKLTLKDITNRLEPQIGPVTVKR